LTEYDLLIGSSGRLVIRAKRFGDERRIVMYLEKSVVRISSWSIKKGGIKTSRCSAIIEGNLLTTGIKP